MMACKYISVVQINGELTIFWNKNFVEKVHCYLSVPKLIEFRCCIELIHAVQIESAEYGSKRRPLCRYLLFTLIGYSTD